jgi:hypothetical protein
MNVKTVTQNIKDENKCINEHKHEKDLVQRVVRVHSDMMGISKGYP